LAFAFSVHAGVQKNDNVIGRVSNIFDHSLSMGLDVNIFYPIDDDCNRMTVMAQVT